MQFGSRAPRPSSVAFNLLALLGVTAVLVVAFVWQFVFGELPCPLCLLQRMAFVLAGVGLLLNLRFGPSPAHYAMVLVAGLGGAAAAGRQLLLHQAAGDPGFGTPVLGLHFYTWAFVAFILLMVYCAFMMALDRKASDNAMPHRVGLLCGMVIWLFFLVVLANTVTTTLQCGMGPCPDNPSRYELLPSAGA
jgi:disulfide bond formation protein DsbB